jgi:hypothetical protein
MPVEISVLSGSRQGELLFFQDEQFRVGDEPACELYFNPALDPGARDRLVLFRHREDGWTVLPLGTPGMMLDYAPLADAAPIRSGQVVRMSADGPDFSFRVIAASEVRKPALRLPPAPLSEPLAPTPAVPPAVLATLAAAAAGPPLNPPAVPVPAVPKPAPRSAAPSLPVLVLAGIGLAAVVLVVGWSMMQSAVAPSGATGATAVDNEQSSPPPSPAASLPRAGEGSQPSVEPRSSAAAAENPTPAKPEAQPPAADPLEPVRQALYLLQVELALPDGSTIAYPQATCCAVSEHELLTTGNVGCELLRFRAQKYKIFATRPEEQLKLPVAEIRIRTDFIHRETDRQGRRYCDLALLKVEGNLPHTVPLAARSDLAAPHLEDGVRFRLGGYPHDGNKITPHDQFPIQSFEGKVFVIRAQEPQQADTPLCLDLLGQLPANAYGFGVFNRDGKLVGVYNELPGAEETHGVKNLHVITAVHPELIERGLRQRDPRVWVEPQVINTAAREGQR